MSHSALLLLALASLWTSEATTTTTAADSMGTTTTQAVSGTTITGTMTISGITYADLADDTQMMAQVETECKETIATSAGPNVSPADVSVTLSAGSLQVGYSIIVDADDASSISSAISTAVESGTLVDSLVTNLQTIPNIANIVSGTLSAVASAPTVVEDPNSGASTTSMVVEDPSSGALTTSMCTMTGLVSIAAVATLQL